MDFSYSEEQQAVRELAAQIIGDGASDERLQAFDPAGEGLDRELWRALADANLLGTALPEANGGMGLDLLALCGLLEQAGRHTAPVPLVPALVLGALPIAEFGTPAQRERWLPRVIAGETLLTAALTELGGADPARPRTRATPDGDGWRLDGAKECVPAAELAERVLVPARGDDGTTGVFLLDPRQAGVTLERQQSTNREPQSRIELAGAAVSADDVLGDRGDGARIVRWLGERAAVAYSAVQLGVAEAALERTAAYTSERKQFGRPIGSFQAVSLRAADAYISVEAMRCTLQQAVYRLDAGLPAAREVAAAKWWSCRGGQDVVHTAQHLHGGIGADLDYPIHRYFLWAKQNELQLGGAQSWLARLGALLVSEERAS